MSGDAFAYWIWRVVVLTMMVTLVVDVGGSSGFWWRDLGGGGD